jgi:hypothetical protein
MTKPDFSGTWRLNLKKSHLLGAPVAEVEMRIAHDEPDFVQDIKTVFADGRIALATFRGVSTGASFENTIGEHAVTSRAIWDGDTLVIESSFAGSRLRDRWSLSSDGSELHMAHLDDALAGQIAVLERR